jgi:hypothetical protein
MSGQEQQPQPQHIEWGYTYPYPRPVEHQQHPSTIHQQQQMSNYPIMTYHPPLPSPIYAQSQGILTPTLTSTLTTSSHATPVQTVNPTLPQIPLPNPIPALPSKPSRGKKVTALQTRSTNNPSDIDNRLGLSFPLLNQRGELLPVPKGAILEVQNLLLLHPPSTATAKQPLNQYTKKKVLKKVDHVKADIGAGCDTGAVRDGKDNNDEGGIFGHKSRFEMYTCRVCAKTYDGKNARSVARRHLQDKHGVPLSLQGRRSRWDDGKSAFDVHHSPSYDRDIEMLHWSPEGVWLEDRVWWGLAGEHDRWFLPRAERN